jgi:lysophospholipase L1-like esterase
VLNRFQPPETGREPFRLGSEQLAETPIPQQVAKLREPVPAGIEADPQEPGEPFAAHAQDRWFDDPRYAEAQGWAFDPGVAWRPMNPQRFLDWTSTYVNVVGGHRLSWTPPACSCKRLNVWVYGGSTTFGLDQRDEGTISSWLAKTAYADGVTVDVSNRGMPGHVHWQEAELFANDLTQEAKPDLVIFYDGVNDAAAGYAYSDKGYFDLRTPVDSTTIDVWNSTKRSDPPVPSGPPGSRMIGPDKSPGDADIAGYTMRQYNWAREVSGMIAEQAGIPIVYVWQPSRYTRPIVLSEPHFDTDAENATRLQQQMVNDLLPSDVIDLTDALDDNTDAIYTDDVHHNEQGSQIIAEKLYAKIAPELKRLGT